MKILGYILGVLGSLVLVLWLIGWERTGFTTRTKPIALACMIGDPEEAACFRRSMTMPPLGTAVGAIIVLGTAVYLVRRPN